MVQPIFISMPWASEGQYATIPETTAEPGRASLSQGFPPVTAVPLSAGGIPPNWLDFQGAFNLITNNLCFAQTGATWSWSDSLDYPVGAVVLGSDNVRYLATAISGPGSGGAVDPTGAGSGTAWTQARVPLSDSVNSASSVTAASSLAVKTVHDASVRAVNGSVPDSSGNVIIATGVPVGTVLAFAANTDPDGYVICNGAEISRNTYSELFGVIGTLYGAGDGSTTFNLPDMTDRFIQGSATSGNTVDAGLPDITGRFRAADMQPSAYVGAFYHDGTSSGYNGGTSQKFNFVGFEASLSNPIYGNSDTVQPPALTMRYYIKY